MTATDKEEVHWLRWCLPYLEGRRREEYRQKLTRIFREDRSKQAEMPLEKRERYVFNRGRK